jgi:hypothetical protein
MLPGGAMASSGPREMTCKYLSILRVRGRGL